MKKIIAVVCGGYSGESVVSMKSADFVINNLDSNLYISYKIVISPTEWFCLIDENKYEINKNDFSFSINNKKITFNAVYNIIHGNPGENGRLQAYFELLNIPISCCDSTISALTFNKAYCNHIVKSLNVNTSPSVHLFKGDEINILNILSEVGLPCFVKPNSGGSSIGMTKVKQEQELENAIKTAFKEDEEVLIESFFKGREVTCGLIKIKNKITVFPICEIVSKKDFFDFEAKYNDNLVEEIIPAPIPEDVENTIKSTSVFLYNKLNMKGIVRIDYIFNNNEYIFLEINTIPGMSAQSIIPKMARQHGWTNTQLLTAVMEETIS